MASARIDAIIARDAGKAVVFRRGPSKLTQQLVWDFETDEVTPGQWIKGRVYTRRCDVSPDGRYLVGAFTNYSDRFQHAKAATGAEWETCGWTAVSRPPYFTAIALWFTGGAWNGGGIWDNAKQVRVNNFPYHWKEALRPSRAVRVDRLNLPASEDDPIFGMLMKNRGWQNVQEFQSKLLNPDWRTKCKQLLSMFNPLKGLDMNKLEEFTGLLSESMPNYEQVQEGVWIKPFENGRLERHEGLKSETWTVCDLEGKARLKFQMPQFGMQFLDVDTRGRIVYGHDGKLWAWAGFPDGEPQVVADLNSNRFEPVPPPVWATEW